MKLIIIVLMVSMITMWGLGYYGGVSSQAPCKGIIEMPPSDPDLEPDTKPIWI